MPGKERPGAIICCYRCPVHPDIWVPGDYRRVAGPRVQAVLDLLARARHPKPRLVADLGCGPGDNTVLVAQHYPDALVIGVDQSPGMIAAAAELEQPGRLEFRVGDVATWQADEPPDIILLNAVLQWVPDHAALLSGLAARLAPGGVLGFQMPGILSGGRVPAMLEVARGMSLEPRWRDQLGRSFTDIGDELLDPAGYIRVLAEAGLQAQAWETRYAYLLPGTGRLTEFAAGSILRPALARLAPTEAGEFLAEYQQRLSQVDPPRVIGGSIGELLIQERVFAVGRLSPAA